VRSGTNPAGVALSDAAANAYTETTTKYASGPHKGRYERGNQVQRLNGPATVTCEP